MACSIKRKAGARVEALSCVGHDDRPPEPQEVVKGELHTYSCIPNAALSHHTCMPFVQYETCRTFGNSCKPHQGSEMKIGLARVCR